MKPCEWCATEFKPSVTYQIYCSVKCREEATKQKIAERYLITRRTKRAGKKRICAGGCGTTLSVYNDDVLCSKCFINEKAAKKVLRELKGFFDYEQE